MDRKDLRNLPNNMPAWLPSEFAGKRIKYREPYTMAGELIVPAGAGSINVAFPDATFIHTTDIPFEIWNMVVRASQGVDPANFVPIAEPAPGINKFWRVRINDEARNQRVTKSAQLVGSLVDTDDNVWWWADPVYLVNGQGFDISVDNLLPANALRAEITLRGFLTVIAPPSNTR